MYFDDFLNGYTLAVKSSAFADWLTGLVFYTDFIALVPPVSSAIKSA